MNLPKKLIRYAGLAAAAVLASVSYAGPASATATAYKPVAGLADGTLTIIGTDYDDDIVVTFSADAKTVVVDLAEDVPTKTFYRRDVTRVSAFLRAGDDELRVPVQTVLATTTPTIDAPLTVFGGAGDDAVFGGTGDDRLFGGQGDDELQGGRGIDVLYGDQGRDVVDGGVGNDVEFLGSGNDTALWVPGEGSDIVHGGYGYDRLDFVGANVAEVMSVSAEGKHAVLLREQGSIRMDTNQVEALNVAALGGADKVTVNNLAGTSLVAAEVDLSGPENLAAGDGAEDAVVVYGTSRPDYVDVRAVKGAVEVDGLPTRTTISGSESTDHLSIYTLAGRDRVVLHRGAADLIGIKVALGIQ